MKMQAETVAKDTYQESEDLKLLLCGEKFKLDCGHHVTFGHSFANTIVIFSLGGGRIKTACLDCADY